MVISGREPVIAPVALRPAGEVLGDEIAEGAGQVVAGFVVVDDEVGVFVGVAGGFEVGEGSGSGEGDVAAAVEALDFRQ